MKLEKARTLGMQVVEALAPACDRIMIAGSVRRGKAEPKDIEIVYIATLVERQKDLFSTGDFPLTEERIGHLVAQRFWQFDEQVKRNGPKYKRLVMRAKDDEQIVVELFRAASENWGLQLALRTGPAPFNHQLVTRIMHGGCMPVDMMMSGGFLWRRGLRLDTPTEESFFEELGVPCWPPEERSPVKLSRFLFERRKHKLDYAS